MDWDENKSVSWEQGEEIELGKGIQEETVGMERYLRGDMETQYNGNFLKYMKTFLIRSPNNSGYGVPTGHPLLPNKVSSTWNRFD